MTAPLDYAATDRADTEALGVEAGDITYAALLDRHAAAEPITDEMIREAGRRMDIAHAEPIDAQSSGPSGEQRPRKLARFLRIGR